MDSKQIPFFNIQKPNRIIFCLDFVVCDFFVPCLLFLVTS